MAGEKIVIFPSISSSCTYVLRQCARVCRHMVTIVYKSHGRNVCRFTHPCDVFTQEWREVGVKLEDVNSVLFPTLE